MRIFRSKRVRLVWLNSLAGICQNISAAWFGLILVSPGFEAFRRDDWLWLLTASLLFGIFFLYLSVWLKLEEK